MRHLQNSVQSEATNFGGLIGRADLSDDQMIEAIRARLSGGGRDPASAEAVIEAARMGDDEAKSLVQTIAVPAPVSKLNMPTQCLTREGRNRFGLAFGRLGSMARD